MAINCLIHSPNPTVNGRVPQPGEQQGDIKGVFHLVAYIFPTRLTSCSRAATGGSLLCHSNALLWVLSN